MVDIRLKNRNNFILWLNDYFNIIMAGILILFLALAYWLILEPKFALTQEAIQTTLTSEKNLYSNSQKKLAILTDIQKVYQNIKPTDLQKFNSVLPGAYVPERLFGEIEEIAQTGGWPVSSIVIGSGNVSGDAALGAAATSTVDFSQYPGLAKIDLTVSLAAVDYPGLKSFLRLLENNLRLMDVTSLNWDPTSRSAVVKLSTYYYQHAQ